jgi:hypothetical protein
VGDGAARIFDRSDDDREKSDAFCDLFDDVRENSDDGAVVMALSRRGSGEPFATVSTSDGACRLIINRGTAVDSGDAPLGRWNSNDMATVLTIATF